MKTAAARALRATTVRDVMRMQMVTVVPEMTLPELAQTLLESGVRSAPVLAPTGKILGVASQTELVRLSAGSGAAPERLRVRDVMGPVGPTIAPDEPLPRLVRRFVRERVQRALVVENGILLGIVTPIDVLTAIDEAH
ncbi:CBS domain-containing protein [Longimicrobium sp.]|jgi:CBS domain-containing membrane protein|uniref:CBS domain-containing protein n=1 Tax=Longimicrobium sp. TaxID=2029185 RepID=UPI002F95FD16